MLADAALLALNTQTELFTRAAGWAGRPRECVIALGQAEEFFFRLYPQQYRALQVVRVASQLASGGAVRRDAAQRCESRLIALLQSVISTAVDCGDLKLKAPLHGGDLAFVLWSLAFGTRALMGTAVATRQLGIVDGFATANAAVSALLDALGWRPLSNEVDYEQVRARIREGLFAAEWQRLSALSGGGAPSRKSSVQSNKTR